MLLFNLIRVNDAYYQVFSNLPSNMIGHINFDSHDFLPIWESR